MSINLFVSNSDTIADDAELNIEIDLALKDIEFKVVDEENYSNRPRKDISNET